MIDDNNVYRSFYFIASDYSTERVRYTYVFKDTQPEFVSALSTGEGSPLEPLLHIVIIWRRDANHLKYEWLPTGWIEAAQDETQWNETRRNLEQTIQRLLRASEALPYAAIVGELADEHAQVCSLFFSKLKLCCNL